MLKLSPTQLPTLVYVLASVVAVASILHIVYYHFTVEADSLALERQAPQSVEIDIAELSPAGAAGGLAVPASGCSCGEQWCGKDCHRCAPCPPPPPPPPAPSISFTVSPSTVNSGGSATLTWSTSNTTSCSASGNWSGSKALSGSQSSGAVSSNQSYTLTCSGAGGTRSVTRTLTVLQPSVDLNALPSAVPLGGASTLSWNTSNVVSCAASAGWSGSKALSGTESTGALSGFRTYRLTCTNGFITTADQVSVSILPECNDTLDNDSDGDTDTSDPGCTDPNDGDETSAADLSAGGPTLVNGPLEVNRTDDGQFSALITNVGDNTSATINYAFEIDLDSDGSVDLTESGAKSGGIDNGTPFTTSPLETFANLPDGNHRVRLNVTPVSGETNTSNNISAWSNFSVAEATINLFPSISADPRNIRADEDSSPDTTISWDTDQWPSCALTGPGLPSTATSVDGNTIGIDGTADLDLDFTSTFTIDCDGDLGNGIDEAEVTVNVQRQVFEQ